MATFRFILSYQGNDARKNLMNMLDSAKVKLDDILQVNSELVIKNCKVASTGLFWFH